ncbi:MAG: hypothetical protein HOE48_25490 [Candidatus Latescibacteria bacterium]|nr:hypothetical protein [Candidatus Latescibacterota bacterium]MBT4141286.1 hypothetical protein [Candidatus Latescibacterota bacterium]
MVHRNFPCSFYVFLLAILCVSSVDAVDTLQVATPDPLLEDWRWTEYDRRSGLAGKALDPVFEDRDGNIWFATDQGAQKYDGVHWTTYTTEDGLAHNTVYKIMQARDGAMWIGTGDVGTGGGSAGITRLVDASYREKIKTTTHTFDGWDGVRGILEAADGTVWINMATPNQDDIYSLRRYVNGQWETVNQPMQAFMHLVQDREGAIWTGTSQQGVALRFDGVRWTQVDVLVDATENSYYRVYIDSKGYLCVTHSKGYSRLNRGVWEHHTNPIGPEHFAEDGTICDQIMCSRKNDCMGC